MIYMINKIVAIQGDLLSKLNPKTDTSIYLAIGAQKLKYKIFYYEPSNLSIIGNKVVAKGHFVIFNYSKKKFFKIVKEKSYANLHKKKTQSGAHDAQVKITSLTNDSNFGKEFKILKIIK